MLFIVKYTLVYTGIMYFLVVLLVYSLHEYLRTTHRSNDSNFLEKVAKLYSNDQQITKVSLSCAEAALFASIRNVRCCGPVIVNVSV